MPTQLLRYVAVSSFMYIASNNYDIRSNRFWQTLRSGEPGSFLLQLVFLTNDHYNLTWYIASRTTGCATHFQEGLLDGN
jgi:hypothetical protein